MIIHIIAITTLTQSKEVDEQMTPLITQSHTANQNFTNEHINEPTRKHSIQIAKVNQQTQNKQHDNTKITRTQQKNLHYIKNIQPQYNDI